MASHHTAILIILLSCFLFSCTLHAQSFIDVCGILNPCVHGSCSDTAVLPYYDCQCSQGWKRLDDLTFLPCVLPNCSINLACTDDTTPPAPPPPAVPANVSLNICSIPICGNGQCIQNSTASNAYVCECDAGYSNWMNKPDGFCLRQCSIAADCTGLTDPLMNHPSSTAIEIKANQGILKDLTDHLPSASKGNLCHAYMWGESIFVRLQDPWDQADQDVQSNSISEVILY